MNNYVCYHDDPDRVPPNDILLAPSSDMCTAICDGQIPWACTRYSNHPMPHAADSDGHTIIATWED